MVVYKVEKSKGCIAATKVLTSRTKGLEEDFRFLNIHL